MTTDDFKNITEGWKNIVLLVAIVIGGGWSLYVFNSKLEVENAKAQLEKTRQELDLAPVVTASIDSSYFRAEDGYFIKVQVVLKNKGRETGHIYYKNNSLTVSKVEFDGGKISGYSNTVYTDNVYPEKNGGEAIHKIVGTTLIPGHEKKANYIVSVRATGIYQIVFRVKPGIKIVDERNGLEISKGTHIVSADGFINVH